MTDREERQHVIEVLKSWDGYFIGYTSDEVQEALRYAISSIETDLKYDLLYEETSGQADKQADKPTTKDDCETCIHNKDVLECDMYGCKYEPTTKNEAKYCNRNICLKNEYNNIGCEDCEVTKSQEPATKNDLRVDCISRQAVLDEAFEVDTKEYGRIEVVGVDAINSLPPVTPQPKTGHWVHGEYCSECGCDVPAYIIDWKWQRDMNAKYCPNCGAKMVEAKDMAIKALEQESILNKIRAEIDTARFIDKDTKLCKNANASGLEVAMQIIDKYKAESEE